MPHLVKAPDGTYHAINQTWVKTGASTWKPATVVLHKVNRTAARTITNKALTGNVATLTTSGAHGFAIGDLVRVTGVDATFNGDFVITTTPLTTTFTYAKTATNVTSVASGGSARSEYWQEIWPMSPLGATSLTSTQPYQNDRIELTFAWVAPAGGAATATYRVVVWIGGVQYNAYTITHPTVSMTLTNTTGFQSYAGQSMYFTVVPKAANGASGPMATSATYTIPQLPAPPDPTGFAVTMSGGNLTESWSHVSGNRLVDFELQVNRNAGAYTSYTVAKGTSASTSQNPWDGSAVNGGAWTARVRARGAGGNSNWVSVSGAIPADVTLTNYKFLAGLLRANFARNADTTSIDIHYQIGTATPVLEENSTAASGVTDVNASSGWARDNATQYRLRTTPKNAFGSARTTVHGYMRKLPNPITVDALGQNTKRAGLWRNDPDFVYQGYTASGNNYGYALYGNLFYDRYNATWVGYDVNPTLVELFLMRHSDGGYSNGGMPRVWLHTAGGTNEANEGSWTEGTDLAAFGFATYGWRTLPLSWGSKLIKRTNGVKGVGMYHPDTALVTSASLQYSKWQDQDNLVIFVGTAFQVRITHDG